MPIERDKSIIFDDQGTLIASTRWISTHDEGVAEWMKNARRAYQVDRGNVAETDRVCVELQWVIDNEQVARIDGGVLTGRHGGSATLYARVAGTAICSSKVMIEVWVVDHVLLTPRSLEILLGRRETVT